MNNTANTPTAQPAERVLHGEVVGVNAIQHAANPPKYRVEISVGAGTEATLYVTLDFAPALWEAYDVILRRPEVAE
jgi:hypothetical protein